MAAPTDTPPRPPAEGRRARRQTLARNATIARALRAAFDDGCRTRMPDRLTALLDELRAIGGGQKG